MRWLRFCGRAVFFWIVSAMKRTVGHSRIQPQESPHRRWVRTIGTCSITFSVWRKEVMFCVGHAIHHYAILKLLCAGVGVKLPYEFGIAPSTLKHLQTQAAERG